MNVAYLDALANFGASLITHIGLVDGNGVEMSGGAPAYARQPVSWTLAADGSIHPVANLDFNIPAGATVAGWRGFSAGTGGVEYGGQALTSESFVGQGQYRLLSAGTAINHT